MFFFLLAVILSSAEKKFPGTSRPFPGKSRLRNAGAFREAKLYKSAAPLRDYARKTQTANF